MYRTLMLRRRAWTPLSLALMLYFGAASVGHTQSGDAPFAGFIVGDLFPGSDVVVTTACLRGNPFVPNNPPAILGSTPTLSGCKLDIPARSETAGGADTSQLIVVLPNNYQDRDVLTSVRTFGSGSNTGIEFGVTADAVAKDVFFGLANPGLFESPPVFATSDVASTADVFCTSVNGRFACAKVEPGNATPVSCPSGLLNIVQDAGFCSDLTNLLQDAYNLARNPLAYATSTNMTRLAQPNSVTLRLCPGFQAQCLSPAGSPSAPIQANAQVTTMHTQASFVETPRTRCCAFP